MEFYDEVKQAKADIENRDKIFVSEREEEYDISYIEDKRRPLKSKLGIIGR